MAKSIEINIKNSTGYEVLYPNIIANNVIDFSGDNPLLSESTAGLFGLGSGAVPNDVLQILSKAVIYNNNGMTNIGGIGVSNIKTESGSVILTGSMTTIVSSLKPFLFLAYYVDGQYIDYFFLAVGQPNNVAPRLTILNSTTKNDPVYGRRGQNYIKNKYIIINDNKSNVTLYYSILGE